jgi:FkbM family methyltransferase
MLIYRQPWRHWRLQKLYRPWVGPGRLVFDIGAHLGDRTRTFASLGARVIAFEPQPHLRAWLEKLEGHKPQVEIRPDAVGPELGTATLAISARNPTLSTLAHQWREQLASRHQGFAQVAWDESIEVPVVTLDHLIEQYGIPQFCKIDVEGFEPQVLAGLSHPIPALSFEFIQGHHDQVMECLSHLNRIAPNPYRFNVVIGEQRVFHFPQWVHQQTLVDWLAGSGQSISSGDIYAEYTGELNENRL